MIDAAAAIAEAKRGLRHMQLDDNPGMAAARAAGHAGVPMLVTRLDVPERAYYLVPWQDDRGITLVIQIDAQTGVMSSAAALAAPQQHIVISPEQAQRIASDTLGVQAVDTPQLVWQACRETGSPFQPLYLIPVVDSHVFVAMNGTAYRQLTPFIKGGRANPEAT
ncbi:MAG: hypothetical protein P4L77_04520 [Sulfuriferula sp.]|nr:hypothetical protein [Sulfuriferula sp.]